MFAATFFRFGAYAEYACLPETYPVLKPANMTYEEAATIPTGGINGLHFLRAANVLQMHQIVEAKRPLCIGESTPFRDDQGKLGFNDNR